MKAIVIDIVMLLIVTIVVLLLCICFLIIEVLVSSFLFLSNEEKDHDKMFWDKVKDIRKIIKKIIIRASDAVKVLDTIVIVVDFIKRII